MLSESNLTDAQKITLTKITTSKSKSPEKTFAQIKRSCAQITEEALNELVEKGLLTIIAPTGRSRTSRYAPTDTGREFAKTLTPPKKRTTTQRLTELEEGINQIKQKLDELTPENMLRRIHDAIEQQIEAALESREYKAVAGQPVETVPRRLVALDEFEYLVREAITEISETDVSGGVVEIPNLKKNLQGRLNIDQLQFDEMLLDLEKREVLNLQIANDPSRIPEDQRAQGIQRPGRGLLYYVLLR